MPDDDYRKWLLGNQTHEIDTYGALLVKLSGGGLALSFTFIRQIAGPNPVCGSMIGFAWTFWVISLVCLLIAHYCSALAMEEAIRQHDKNQEVTGGKFDSLTRILNISSALAFGLGALLAGWFAIVNLEER